ncbi:hypothetical protein BS78_04G081500 [Paspalum vaginatum]|nr:hypothetical protein BS78_04G081500 [Paspalum vaginatum]
MEIILGFGATSSCNTSPDLDLHSSHENDTLPWKYPHESGEVTVRHAYYPITEKVLYDVFSPFGVVERVLVDKLLVAKGPIPVFAQVVFQSRYEAADAFGELHGRNIYDGCCQMEINWGLFQEPDVSMGTRDGDIPAHVSSVQLPSSPTAVSTLDESVVVSSTVGCDEVDAELLVPAVVLINKEPVPDMALTFVAAKVCSATAASTLDEPDCKLAMEVDANIAHIETTALAPAEAVATIAKESVAGTEVVFITAAASDNMWRGINLGTCQRFVDMLPDSIGFLSNCVGLAMLHDICQCFMSMARPLAASIHKRVWQCCGHGQ